MQRKLILTALVASLVIAASAQPAFAAGGKPAATRTTVACTRLSQLQIRCTMAIKGGSGMSGTVSMRITRGNLLVALGKGRVRDGKATLTMHLLRRMPPSHYTVAMVISIRARRVLFLR